jgi:hypothetical protein
MYRDKKKKPSVVWGHKLGFNKSKSRFNYNRNPFGDKFSFKRNNLPSPLSYYKNQFSEMPRNKTWVNVQCCFHDDNTPSLSLNLESGGFFCHSCGEKGGNVLDFHIKKYNLGFKDAAKGLGGLQ